MSVRTRYWRRRACSFCTHRLWLGIFVALTLLWLGAIEKALASVSAVLLTGFGQHMFISHDLPGLLEATLALGIINGILQFSVLRPK